MRIRPYTKVSSSQIGAVAREMKETDDALPKLESQKAVKLLWVIPLEIKEKPEMSMVSVMQIDETYVETWITPIWTLLRMAHYSWIKLKSDDFVIKLSDMWNMMRFYIEKVSINLCWNVLMGRNANTYYGRYMKVFVVITLGEGSSLAIKILRHGNYWPTMKEDAFWFARSCDKCQCFTNYTASPIVSLTPITSSWPFAIWRINQNGKLLKTWVKLDML